MKERTEQVMIHVEQQNYIVETQPRMEQKVVTMERTAIQMTDVTTHVKSPWPEYVEVMTDQVFTILTETEVN